MRGSGGSADRAVQAAIAAARSVGLIAERARVLWTSTHVTVVLEPCLVVARVITDPQRWQLERAEREVAVTRTLAEAGAPVAAPLPRIAAPVVADGSLTTLCEWVEQAGEPDAFAASQALAVCHQALRQHGGSLPSWTEALDDAARLVARESLGSCGDEDRRFLHSRYFDLRERIEKRAPQPVPIHGDAHLGNVLQSALGPRWIDWESACLGPAEWDIASLPEEAVVAWPEHDPALLGLMRSFRSACVSIWCFARGRDSRVATEAARHHLAVLRRTSE